MSNAPLIFDGVSRSFEAAPGNIAGVHNLSFRVEPGEIVCLLGPSGCGKSTTLRLAAGVERCDSGTIRIGDEIIDGSGRFVPPELRRVGLMFQDYALFPHMNVLSNVMFGLSRFSPPEREPRAREALRRVGLAHHAASWPHTLSGGEQQRAALARALAPAPRVMMMDEPFSGLDGRLRESVRDQAISLLREAGTPTLFVTHDPDEALRMASRIILMRKGRIVQAGTPEDILLRPVDREAAAFFSPLNVVTGKVAGGQVETILGRFAATGLADGAAVEIAFRPDDFEIVAAGGTPARVAHCAPGIGGYAIEVEVAGTSFSLRHSRPARNGETILVAGKREKVLVFPTTGA
ncbi:MAG TPA: ABC transporter ATP-binding protein [Micropepsaceae bacterium]|nr:ABC transporter ATP-binding protein [Micropepsaceae bacterium]